MSVRADPPDLSPDLLDRIDGVRRFNRFYTRQIGLLREGLVRTPFSLTEARVIYEIARHQETTATQLADELGLDPGYVTRILRGFERRDLIAKRTSEADRRQNLITLTDPGRAAFTDLNAATNDEIAAMLDVLSDEEQGRLLRSMREIEGLLGAGPEHGVSYILRPHRPGDMGWVVHRHGVLYSREYGWDERFEALVAGIVSEFIERFDPERERCWIAERGGENVGSVFLVREREREGVARLRLLLVEPKTRGLGIGKRLVRECTRFALQAGYGKIVLWTNSVLDAARHIYEREGYRLIDEEPHHSYGHDLVGQTWELDLEPMKGDADALPPVL